MSQPQPGVFVEGASEHTFLHADMRQGVVADDVRIAVRRVIDVAAAGEDVNVVIGFGPSALELLGIETPDDYEPFSTLGTGNNRAEAVQHDLFVWLHGHSRGLIFDTALAARRAFDGVADIAEDVTGFVYHDARDLTGFVDGTENPSREDALELAVVADGSKGAGGSILLSQRWVHDLDSFHDLPIDQQEAVFGRTQPDSTELSEVPTTAHISRVVTFDEAGDEIEIYRRSVPYGDTSSAGLQFIAFTNRRGKIQTMLDRMFGVSGDGVHDRLTDFTTAVSSGYYFVPAADAF